MAITTRATHACCGGTLGFYSHPSESLGLEARFAVFVPDGASAAAPVPVIHLLAGLTCTEETFLIKANAVRFAAEYRVALGATDTSPRGADIAGEDDSYDFGSGAGFYLDATQAPWAAHDATLLLQAGHTHPTTILVDQGEADQFLDAQLQPWHLEQAARAAGQELILRRHPGYDHSYWFIQSFIQDHLTHHAAILRR
ncbi:MAG: alpha/beta hydrolase-fold protein [Gluconacetobacter sp.]